jgi:uncharacterized RDD family membrane protein YckC
MNDIDHNKLYYAAWWRRFLAHMIDLCVLAPLMVLQLRIGTVAPRVLAFVLIPLYAIYLGYYVFCHGYWGRTVGKLAMGIRVVNLYGTPISWRQAFLRSIGEICFSVPYWWVFIHAYSTVPLNDYFNVPPSQRFSLIKQLWPSWYPTVSNLNQLWVWSEFVVMLFNKRRRALHDFIAGTVVTQKTPTRRQARDEDPYSIDFDKEMKRLQKL